MHGVLGETEGTLADPKNKNQNVSNLFLIAVAFPAPLSNKPHTCKYGDKLGQPVVSQE